jgi:hypothetical protein
MENNATLIAEYTSGTEVQKPVDTFVETDARQLSNIDRLLKEHEFAKTGRNEH